ncbi:MAG: hypothetical protein Kow0080_14880 [Candidatus Promineifilaceae bacterium]
MLNKRIIFYISVLVLAFALTACGGGEPALQQAQPVAAQPTTPPELTAVPPAEVASMPEVRPDIPVLADASNLTTSAADGGYSVSYSSASGLDGAAAFYQAQMPSQGWVYDANVSSQAGGVNMVLAFNKGGETAAVALTKVGNGVQVVIAVSPREAAETTASDGGELAAVPTTAPVPTAVPPEAAVVPETGETGTDDIPLMENATGVVRAREGADYVVTYQSSSSVDEIAAFYQAEMPLRGWVYDATVSSTLAGVSAEMRFTRADGEAGVSLVTTGLATQVVIAVSGAAADAAETAGASGGDAAPVGGTAAQPTTSAVSPAPTQPPSPATTGSRQDVPLVGDATNVNEEFSGGYALTYFSASSVDTIFAFYQNQMPAYGWTYRDAGTVLVPGTTGTIYFLKNGEEISITMTAQGGVTQVQAVINN